MIGLATFATLSSTNIEEIGDVVSGPAVEVGPDHPEATVRFVFQANPAALVETASASLFLHYTVNWAGSPPGPNAKVQVELDQVGGPTFEPDGLGSISCLGRSCLGTFVARFRWPRGVPSGGATVRWELSWQIDYGHAPPEGAKGKVRFEDVVDGAALARFHEEIVTLGRSDPLIVQTIDIVAARPVSADADLFLEIDPISEYEPELPDQLIDIALLLEDGTTTIVPSSSSTPIPIPPSCREEPCTISFGLAGRLTERDRGRGFWFRWGLSASAGLERAHVSVAPRAVPLVGSTLSLGPVRVANGPGANIEVIASVSDQTLPAGEFGATWPLIQVAFSLNPRFETVVPSEDGTVAVELWLEASARSPGEAYRRRWNGRSYVTLDDHQTAPALLGLPGFCLVDRRCDVTMRLRLYGYDFSDDDVVLRAHPTLEVFVSYPVTGAVPGGAAIDLTMREGK
jgi:hypothetical protein